MVSAGDCSPTSRRLAGNWKVRSPLSPGRRTRWFPSKFHFCYSCEKMEAITDESVLSSPIRLRNEMLGLESLSAEDLGVWGIQQQTPKPQPPRLHLKGLVDF